MEADLSFKREFSIMNHKGDTKLIWDARNADDVANARRTFADLRAKGHLAYKTDKEGKKQEQVNEFDPSIERMVFAPPMVGG